MPPKEKPSDRGKRARSDDTSTQPEAAASSSYGPVGVPIPDDSAMTDVPAASSSFGSAGPLSPEDAAPETTGSLSSGSTNQSFKRQRHDTGIEVPEAPLEDDATMDGESADDLYWDRWEAPGVLPPEAVPSSSTIRSCASSGPHVSRSTSQKVEHEFKLLMWNIENLGGGFGRLKERDDADIQKMARILFAANADVSVIVEVREKAGTFGAANEAPMLEWVREDVSNKFPHLKGPEKTAKEDELLGELERDITPCLWKLYFSDDAYVSSADAFGMKIREKFKPPGRNDEFYHRLFGLYSTLYTDIEARIGKLMPRFNVVKTVKAKQDLQDLLAEEINGEKTASFCTKLTELSVSNAPPKGKKPWPDKQYYQNILDLKLHAQLPLFLREPRDEPQRATASSADTGTGVKELLRLVEEMNKLSPSQYNCWPNKDKALPASYSACETYGFIYKTPCSLMDIQWVNLDAPNFSRQPLLARFQFHDKWLRVVAWHAPSDSPHHLYRRGDMFPNFAEWCKTRRQRSEVPLFMAADLNIATQALAEHPPQANLKTASSSSSMSMEDAAGAVTSEDQISNCLPSLTISEFLSAVTDELPHVKGSPEPTPQWSSSLFLGQRTSLVKSTFEVAPTFPEVRHLYNEFVGPKDAFAFLGPKDAEDMRLRAIGAVRSITEFAYHTPSVGHVLNAFDKITAVYGVREGYVTRGKEEIIDEVNVVNLMDRLKLFGGELPENAMSRSQPKTHEQGGAVSDEVAVMRDLSDHLPISVTYRIRRNVSGGPSAPE